MNQLPIFLNLAGRPVILLGEGDAADAKRRLVARAGGIAVGEDNLEAKIAIVAIAEEAEARAAVDRLKARGLLVNAIDRPALCDFTVPAIIDRDPVCIAIGTGGASAGLAKALRLRLELLLPPYLGELAQSLFAARPRIYARWSDAAERRRAIDAALGQGAILDPLAKGSADRVDQWLKGEQAEAKTGLFRISLKSNEPDDLTLGQARLLGAADIVLHTSDISPEILARVRADAVMLPLDTAKPQPVEGNIQIILTLASPESS